MYTEQFLTKRIKEQLIYLHELDNKRFINLERRNEVIISANAILQYFQTELINSTPLTC